MQMSKNDTFILPSAFDGVLLHITTFADMFRTLFRSCRSTRVLPWLLLWACGAQAATIVSGKSGIEAIDTLPLNEWDIATPHNSLPAVMAMSLLPGGAQMYTGHYVRGGFLVTLETALAYEVFYNKPLQQQKRFDDAAVSRDSASYFTRRMLESPVPDSIPYWQARYLYHAGRVRFMNDKKLAEEDLRRSELAWMLGLHVYGMFDAYGIWHNNNARSTEKREVRTAVWKAALVPGWGQIYNDEYGKAGLLYMAIIGSVASLESRQRMVDYYVKRHRVAVQENNTTETTQTEEDLLFFRKKRNQYIWGLALFYLYSIADAAVDATLSDFDNPMYWTLAPIPKAEGGFSAEIGWRF